jgi:glycosyltransferase involved in cell wall biosynthesis
MFNPITLSICVTTRNRKRYLLEFLGHFITLKCDNLEVVVTDASDDGLTLNLNELETFSSMGVNFNYCEISDSSGYDADMNLAVLRSRGDFVWPISDDDAISLDHLSQVIDELCLNSSKNVFIFNAQVFDSNMSNILIPRYIDFKKKSHQSLPLQLLYNDFINELSFTGVAIIKRSFWTSIDRSYLFNSLFITTGVIFTTKRDIDVCCIDIPLVKMRFGNASWTANYMKIWIDTWPLFLNSLNFSNYDNSKIGLLVWLKKCLIFKSLNVFKIKKVFLLKNVPSSFKLLSLIFILIPRFLLVAILKLILPRHSLIYLEIAYKYE